MYKKLDENLSHYFAHRGVQSVESLQDHDTEHRDTCYAFYGIASFRWEFIPQLSQSFGLEKWTKYIQFTIEMYSLINERRASISNVIGNKSIEKRTPNDYYYTPNDFLKALLKYESKIIGPRFERFYF